MIIFDYSGIAFASALEHLTTTKDQPSTDLLRHLVLNSMRAVTSRHKGTFGPEVIIAMDGRQYWRRTVFAPYKHKRKEQRESSGQNWTKVFELLEPLKTEFPVSLPYKTLRLDGAEADDIIGVLTMKYAPHQPILIVSSDKDFIQLHEYGPRVLQYSPAKKTMIGTAHPHSYLKQLIFTGDKGDGIPNVLSADDTFVTGIRQKPLTQKRLTEMMEMSLNELPTEILRNYKRNEQLIDFTQIPDSVVTQIHEAYDRATSATKQEFLSYLISHKCARLVECIHEF